MPDRASRRVLTAAGPPARLDIETSTASADDGLVTAVTLRGEVDSYTSPKVDATIDELVEGPAALVIDLGGVTFIDSAGLRSFIRAHQLLAGTGGLVLRNVPRNAQRIFEITGLADQFGFE